MIPYGGKVPKIIYDAGSGPTTLTFSIPPVQKPGQTLSIDYLEAERHDVDASDGTRQSVTEYIEILRPVQMDWVPITDLPAWAEFMAFAVTGAPFVYYPDAANASDYGAWTMEETKWSPKWAARGFAKFSFTMRKYESSAPVAGVPVTPSSGEVYIPDGDGGGAAGGVGTLTPTHTLAQITGHNTPAISDYKYNSAIAQVQDNFTGQHRVGTSLIGHDETKMDDSLNVASPVHVSDEGVDDMLYAGCTADKLMRMMPWWNNPKLSGHRNIGYSSTNTAQIDAQIAFFLARDIDVLSCDWYGELNTHHNTWLQAVRDRCEADGTMKFCMSYDAGAIRYLSAGTRQAKMITDLQYAKTEFFDSAAYYKRSATPVVFIFGVDNEFDSEINFATVAAAVTGGVRFYFRNAGGVPASYADGTSKGGFPWPAPETVTNQDPSATKYLENVYKTQQLAGNAAQDSIGSVYKGFNATMAAWKNGATNIHITQANGLTLLRTFAVINQYWSTSNQIDMIEFQTANDWEEGTALECGVDNFISVAASVQGNILLWNVSGGSGDEQTIRKYNVWVSDDAGANFQLLLTKNVGTGRSINLGIEMEDYAADTYHFLVEAVGKAFITNKVGTLQSWTKTV